VIVDSSVARGLVCRESQGGFERGRLLLQRPAASAVVARLGPIAKTNALSTAAAASRAGQGQILHQFESIFAVAEAVARGDRLTGGRYHDLAGSCFDDLAALTGDLSQDPEWLWWLAEFGHGVAGLVQEDHRRDLLTFVYDRPRSKIVTSITAFRP
jgi:hypothetical protein